ncbi:MAG TPA: ABC transporter permease subunit [Usitatibacter sp.]|nr:ABC transporter permease subunit [Usitatibacter sp.]
MRARPLDAVLLTAGMLVVWHALTWTTAGVALATPWATVERLFALLASSEFWPHVAATLAAFGLALVIAIALGLAMGMWLGLHRLSGEVGEPILVSLYSLPKITLYPLILLVFGLGLSAKVAFGAIHGVIPIVLFTMNAIRTMKPVYYKTARVMRLPRSTLIRRIILPSAAPEIFSGLRIGFALTLLGVLIGEMFASQRGLGFLIVNAIDLHDISRMLAVTLLLALFSIAASVVLLAIDRRLHGLT